ncbi:MAG TPA: hypothetical protein VGL81_27840 [Polyangiaceae bacterium]|jgi:hypothetical protein
MSKLSTVLRAVVPAFAPALAAVPVLTLLACSPARSAVPADAHVEILQTQKLVLHGTVAPHPASASCASSAAGSAPQYLQLNEDTMGNIVLRPTGGAAVLHVQELATNKTWCVTSAGDGSGATIPGEFPGGVYSITVEGSHSEGPTSYAVVFERL